MAGPLACPALSSRSTSSVTPFTYSTGKRLPHTSHVLRIVVGFHGFTRYEQRCHVHIPLSCCTIRPARCGCAPQVRGLGMTERGYQTMLPAPAPLEAHPRSQHASGSAHGGNSRRRLTPLSRFSLVVASLLFVGSTVLSLLTAVLMQRFILTKTQDIVAGKSSSIFRSSSNAISLSKHSTRTSVRSSIPRSDCICTSITSYRYAFTTRRE